MTRGESFDIANEARQLFAVEERLFPSCHAEGIRPCINNEDVYGRKVKTVHGPLSLTKSFLGSWNQ